MKKTQAPFLALFILLFAAGCRKEMSDINTQETPESDVISVQSKTTGIAESGWTENSDWNMVEQPSHNVYFTNIATDAITAAAADKGMVRVFKAGANGESVSLPFEETKGSQKLYWYYQVTEGNIMIAVDVYGSKSNPATSSQFKHIVMNQEAVSTFESNGTSRSDLMELSADELVQAGK